MRRVGWPLVFVGAMASVIWLNGCENGDAPPKPSAQAEVFRLRSEARLLSQIGTSDGYVRAAQVFTKVFELRQDPDDLLNLVRLYCSAESWAPGVDQWDEARKTLARFREAVPKAKHPLDIEYLDGLILRYGGEYEAAAERFRRVVEAMPYVAPAWFQLGSCLLSQRKYDEAIVAFKKVFDYDPRHVASHFKLHTSYTRKRDKETAKEWFDKFQKLSDEVGKVSDKEYDTCRFTRLTLVPNERTTSEPAPETIKFEAVPLPEGTKGSCVRFVKTAEGVELWFGGDALGRFRKDATVDQPASVSASRGIREADYDNDGDVDILVYGDGAPTLLRREEDGSFVTVKAFAMAANIIAAHWVDYDHDGDLDLVTLERVKLGGKEAQPRIYRNDGAEQPVFEFIEGLLPGTVDISTESQNVDFAVADLDLENDTDFVFPNESGPALAFLNLRRGPFQAQTIASLANRRSLSAADLGNDGLPDLVAWPHAKLPTTLAKHAGVVRRLTLEDFLVSKIDSLPEMGDVQDVVFADLDNDTDLDAVIATSKALYVLQNREGGKLVEVTEPGVGFSRESKAWTSVDVGDFDADGFLDIAACDESKTVHLFRSTTKDGYRALVLDLDGGSDNKSGVGAQIETYGRGRYQRFRVLRPGGARLGIGARDAKSLDGVSILWPNGVRQPLFPDDLQKAENNRLAVRQKIGLISSCPFLYVFDGEKFRFLTDVIAIAPLDEWLPPGGMAHQDPEEYVRIPGSALVADAGRLRMVITEELRETTYLDRAALIRVLHPKGTVVLTDESTRQGGVVPLRVFVAHTESMRPASSILSSTGSQAGESCLRIDGDYFHGYKPSREQSAGWVEKHSVDIAPPVGRSSSALLLTGRIAWQNSSVAYSVWQRGATWMAPRLDAIRDGRSRELFDDIGFPCGMDRTVVLPIQIEQGESLRLTSNSRLLWDRVAFVPAIASGVIPDSGSTKLRLAGREIVLESEVLKLAQSVLSYRGYSEKSGNFEKHEHVYDFASTTDWRDFDLQEGRATRFGDVRPLAETVDDRLIVIAPGDAVSLDFAAGDDVPEDQDVTYFLKLTGWAKEASFHNSTGREIGPLPASAMSSYPEGAERKSRDESYREYLENYQTRAIKN